MSETQNIATEKVEANWDALSSDPILGDPNFKPTEVPVKEDEVAKDVADPPVIEEKKEEVKEEVKDAPVVEEKKEEGAELTDELKITLEEISDVPQKHPDGSYKAIAQQLGAEIEEDTVESFKSKFISKEEAEKLAKVSKETFFADLDPEVAAALELKELGVPKEFILEPTKEIDAYLKMDDAELVRANLTATDGWTTDMIDTEIELLRESGNLGHEASKVRVALNNDKNAILQNRTELVNKYTVQKQEAATRQKEQQKIQFIETMNKVSTFMGVTIPKEVKEAFIAKYNNGVYDKELLSPDSQVNYVLKKELEGKITKHIQNKASEKAKKEVTDKLLNIPPVKPTSGGKAVINEQADNTWAAIEEDFKS